MTDYTSPHSNRRADRLTSAEVHYLGEGLVWGLGERAQLFELLARLALPHMADAHSLYGVAHAVDHITEPPAEFFLAVRRRGAVLTWDRGVAQAHLGGDPEAVLYIVTVRRNYGPDRINAYVSIDTTWRDFR